MNKKSSRVVSFSIPDGDLSGHKDVQKLKKHCKSTGTNFSYLVLKGIAHVNQELGLNKDHSKGNKDDNGTDKGQS